MSQTWLYFAETILQPLQEACNTAAGGLFEQANTDVG